MRPARLLLSAVLAGAAILGALAAHRMWRHVVPGPADLASIRQLVVPRLSTALSDRGLRLGAPIYVRIFKQTHELEIWVANGGTYEQFRTWRICTWSGRLGPKLKEGDGQSPEGFYAVSRSQLNPRSRFHLSFDIGLPNAFDAHHGRTGTHLMVHGSCVSIGCYAMTDAAIEEIYLLTEAALAGGARSVPVHIFPFRMTAQSMAQHRDSPWRDFWERLRPAYDVFETTRRPPGVRVVDGSYVITR